MRKIHDLFFENIEETVNLGILENGKFEIKKWKIGILLISDLGEELQNFTFDGVAPKAWLRALLHDRILCHPDTNLELSVALAVSWPPIPAVLNLLTMVLEQRLPDTITLEQIEINELENN